MCVSLARVRVEARLLPICRNEGSRFAVVEGGPPVNTRTDFNTHALPFNFANRHIPTMRPGKYGMASERARGVGGKTMLWNAVALRLSHRDFKGYTIDGAGADWPIDYPEMAPYYERIEREVGVCGNRDGLEDLPDGIYLDPPPLKLGDLLLQRGAKELGIPIVQTRKATLTKATPTRPACHYCGNCMGGCDVAAKYNSVDAHMAPAMKTGHLAIFPNSVVREVMVSNENRATGVRFIHRETGKEGEVRARCVAVACACIQSVEAAAHVRLETLSARAGKLQRPTGPPLHPPLQLRSGRFLDGDDRPAGGE